MNMLDDTIHKLQSILDWLPVDDSQRTTPEHEISVIVTDLIDDLIKQYS